MSRARRDKPRKDFAETPTADYGPTAQLLDHHETVLEEAELAGRYRRRLEPAHRRLRKRGMITRESEAAAQEWCDKMQVVEFGGVEKSGNAAPTPSERCMVAYVAACRDYLRRARVLMGEEGERLVAAACYACLPMREVGRLVGGARDHGGEDTALRKMADRRIVTALKKLSTEIDACPNSCQRQASSPVERPEPSQDN